MIDLFAQVQRPDSFADSLDYIALLIFLYGVLPLALVGWVIRTIRDRRRLARWGADNPPENWWTCSCPPSPFNRHNVQTTRECLDCGDRASLTAGGFVVERRARNPQIAVRSTYLHAAPEEQAIAAQAIPLRKARANAPRRARPRKSKAQGEAHNVPTRKKVEEVLHALKTSIEANEQALKASDQLRSVDPEPEATKVVDLMEVLKASVEATKNERTKK